MDGFAMKIYGQTYIKNKARKMAKSRRMLPSKLPIHHMQLFSQTLKRGLNIDHSFFCPSSSVELMLSMRIPSMMSCLLESSSSISPSERRSSRYPEAPLTV